MRFAFLLISQTASAHGSNEPGRINTKEVCEGLSCKCGSTQDPGWYLRGCTVPLGKTKSGKNIPNITGHWEGKDPKGKLHWERVEQCGDRVLVTSVGAGGYFLVHDFPHADSTPENGCHDFSGLKLPSCSKIKVRVITCVHVYVCMWPYVHVCVYCTRIISGN